jgi:ribosomal-protein-alanine N-acetyltransferase
MKISVAQKNDAEPIAMMSQRLIEYDLPWSWTTDRVTRSIRHPETAVVVARDGRRLAGFAIMRFGDADSHLDLLAVGPAYRRRGLGRQMVEWLEACSRTAGLFRVFLELRVDNAAARSFYLALGYAECGRMRGYYAGREDALRMHRILSASHRHV